MFRNLLKSDIIKTVFLLFTMWVGSTRSVHAADFSSSLSFIAQITHESIAKNWGKIVPILNASILVGVGFLWYKMFTAEKKSTRGPQGLGEIHSFVDGTFPQGCAMSDGKTEVSDGAKVDAVQVEQLTVAYQGSDSSCGYHALKNAKVVVDVFAQSGIVCAEQLSGNLQNKKLAENLFGPKGSWRKQVIKERSVQALRNNIFNYLKSFKREIESKNVDFANFDNLQSKRVVSYFLNSLNNPMVHAKNRKVAVTLSDNREISVTIKLGTIASMINTLLDKYALYMATQTVAQERGFAVIDEKSFKEFLEIYNNYDSQEDKTKLGYNNYVYERYEENVLYSDQICACIANTIADFVKKPETVAWSFDLKRLKQKTFYIKHDSGDWLSEKEIKSLVKKQIDEEFSLTIIQDCSVLGAYRMDKNKRKELCKTLEPIESESDEMLTARAKTVKNDSKAYDGEFQEIATAIKNSPNGSMHTFILGTMTKTNRSGHWYTLVLNANKEGNRTYYVMDSIGTNRVHDHNVIRVITELEQAIATRA